MVRPLRLEHAGAVWHVTSRGNARREIFRDDVDRQEILSTLSCTVDTFSWRLHAYVLMSNHYHLLLETPEPTLSRGMHWLNGVYTQRFNRRHERVGHVFQGRFKSILVEKERHLLELVRYVVLNPVRAGLVREAAQWRWSNYAATAGLTLQPRWLEVEWTLGRFGGGACGRDGYRRFVEAGRSSTRTPWEALVGQVFLGGAAFRRGIQAMINERERSPEIPRVQRCPGRPALDAIIGISAAVFGAKGAELTLKRRTPFRLAVAHLASNDAGLSFAELAPALGVRAWAASDLARTAGRLLETNEGFRAQIERIRGQVHSSQT